jgi:glutamine synthetase
MSTTIFPNGHTPQMQDEFVALQHTLQEQGVRYAMGCYVDIHGVPKGKVVPITHLPDMMRGSELYTGYALDGLGQQPNDDELSSIPDPRSLTLLPWQKDVAWMAADNYFNGEPYPLSTRVVLQNQIERAAKLGYTFNLGIEGEIYVLQQDEQGKLIIPNPDDNLNKSCYDIKRMFDAWPFLDRMVTYMQDLGWDVYSFDHEDGQSQFEFDFKYADGSTMADRYIFWRYMAKKVAAVLVWSPPLYPSRSPILPATALISTCRWAMSRAAPTCSKPTKTRVVVACQNSAINLSAAWSGTDELSWRQRHRR